MSAPARRTIELQEFQPVRLPKATFTEELGELLWRTYGVQVAVEFPSPKTGGMWSLISQGWVGYIPLTPELGLRLMPKVALANLFSMWEYAYRLKDFRFLSDIAECSSLEEFYEQLAGVLAKRVLDRGRRGFYRSYLDESDRLPYVRGRMDVRQLARTPWQVSLECDFEEHTADIEDNQILAWTLWRIARSGVCSDRVLPTVRRAYRSLQGLATLQPALPSQCVGRLYHRLNQDYQPLHALSRFFLEQTGPSHETGDHQMMPFLVNMAGLFELFVAEWLRAHLPDTWSVRAQENVPIGHEGGLDFRIDLVLYDTTTDRASCVLDTKYKVAEGPSAADIAQVVAYATARGCTDAVLIYPKPLTKPLDEHVGKIRVRTLAFTLDGDLEAAGQTLLGKLGVWAPGF